MTVSLFLYMRFGESQKDSLLYYTYGQIEWCNRVMDEAYSSRYMALFGCMGAAIYE